MDWCQNLSRCGRLHLQGWIALACWQPSQDLVVPGGSCVTFGPNGQSYHLWTFVSRTGFVGFPGSGNTMMRLLIEAATGWPRNKISLKTEEDCCDSLLRCSLIRHPKCDRHSRPSTQCGWWVDFRPIPTNQPINIVSDDLFSFSNLLREGKFAT